MLGLGASPHLLQGPVVLYICGVYNHILESIPVGLFFHMLQFPISLFLNVPYVSLGMRAFCFFFFLSHGLIGAFVLPNLSSNFPIYEFNSSVHIG